MTGQAYVDVKGPIVNAYMPTMLMPKEVKVTKVEEVGPVYAYKVVYRNKPPMAVAVAYEYLVHFEYDEKDEKIVKDWSERNDRKRRQNH